MATVLVKSDVDETILLNERVEPVHLDSEQSSVQFLERLAWAIEEAEQRRRNGERHLPAPLSSPKP